MSFKTQLEAYFDQHCLHLVETLRANLKTAGEQLETNVRETWPDVGDVHPYATGKGKRSIVRTAPSDDVQRITVEAGHSGYTNHGYTRKGAKTARSWATRKRVEGYGEDVIEESRDELRETLGRNLDGR